MKIFPKLFVAAAVALLSQAASAQAFSGGLPAGWTGSGAFGTMAANGDVSLATGGGSQYGFVSTAGGVTGVSPFDLDGNRNGSVLRSSVFSASAGDALDFDFNFVTSDGSGFSDYGWARLLNADMSQAALLFTARTIPSGNTVPGFGLPATTATVSPSSIIAGAPVWGALGGSSGTCFDFGCGSTGWVSSTYSITASGNYILEFGVINWNDTQFDTGLAFDGITVDGTPISAVPEPESLALMLAGLGLVGATARRRQAKSEKLA
ncbi:MAG: NF038132 family protein [Pseudomonadota bacterium]